MSDLCAHFDADIRNAKTVVIPFSRRILMRNIVLILGVFILLSMTLALIGSNLGTLVLIGLMFAIGAAQVRLYFENSGITLSSGGLKAATLIDPKGEAIAWSDIEAIKVQKSLGYSNGIVVKAGPRHKGKSAIIIPRLFDYSPGAMVELMESYREARMGAPAPSAKDSA